MGYRKRRILVGEKSDSRQGKKGHVWTSPGGVLGHRLVADTSLGLLKYPSVSPKGGIVELMTLEENQDLLDMIKVKQEFNLLEKCIAEKKWS